MPTRRQVLRAAGGAMTIVFGGLQIACTPEEAARVDATSLSDSQILTLAGITQHLFPHVHLDATVYRDAVMSLVESIAGNSDRRISVVNGIAALDAGTRWLDKSPQQQLAALTAIEDSPFFNLVRGSTMSRVYGDERTWEMLGYDGDASKFGGYVDRGFNDIDWLPEMTGESD